MEQISIGMKLMDIIVSSYEGQTNDAKMYNGKGKATFVGGHVYDGKWENNMMHGTGVYTWADGIVYEGDFVYNTLTGKGSYRWPDDSSYTGDVKNGLRHGKGVFTCPASRIASVYEGEWKEGLRHGEGTLWYNKDRTCYYTGHWERGQRSGQGTIVYASGNTYTGQWKNGVKCGLGTMVWKGVNETYTGEWRDDKQHGFGEHYWNEIPKTNEIITLQKLRCNSYIGSWEHGNRHGIGRFCYANGATYEGEWQNNLKHGKGIFIFETGLIYEGEFHEDKMGAIENGSRDSLKLDLGDLLQGSTVKDADMTYDKILKLAIRWNGELREAYKCYTLMRWSEKKTNFCLRLSELWALLLNRSIIGRNFQICSVNRILHAMQERYHDRLDRMRFAISDEYPTQLLKSAGSVHDGDRSLLFREFIELLVRIAVEYYRATPEVNSVQDAFSRFMNSYFTSVTHPTEDAFAKSKLFLSRRAENAAIINASAPSLNKIFDLYALHGDGGDDTITCRSLIQLLRDTNVLNSTFGVKAALEVIERVAFAQGNYDAGDIDNLDAELTHFEFLECLIQIATTDSQGGGQQGGSAERKTPFGELIETILRA